VSGVTPVRHGAYGDDLPAELELRLSRRATFRNASDGGVPLRRHLELGVGHPP